MSDCAWLSGGSRRLHCTGSPHWVAGYLAGCRLTRDCLLSPGGLIWKGVKLPERQKLEGSSTTGHSVASGEALQVLVHSAGIDAQVTAEAPSDSPDSRGLLRLVMQLLFHFSSINYYFQDLGLEMTVNGPERLKIA